jgi:DNA-binding transcriptional MerR regulator
MTISELAKAFAVQPSTLRFYERVGLLSPAGRIGGKRRYDKAAETRLAFILSTKNSGFTLAEIKGLISAASRGTAPRKLWRQATKAKRLRLEREIQRLQAAQRSLMRKAACRCQTLSDCESRLAREWRSS